MKLFTTISAIVLAAILLFAAVLFVVLAIKLKRAVNDKHTK